MGGFASADRVLVAEIALRGQIHKIEEPLFVRRFHDAMSWYPSTSQREYAIWYDPRNAKGFFLHPTLGRGLEYVAGIRHAGLPLAEEVRCQATLLRYAAWDHGVHAVLRRARRRLGLDSEASE